MDGTALKASNWLGRCDAARGRVAPFRSRKSDGAVIETTCQQHLEQDLEPDLENVMCNTNQDVGFSVSHPICFLGGVIGRVGSLTPEGAIVKVADMTSCQSPGRIIPIGGGASSRQAIDSAHWAPTQADHNDILRNVCGPGETGFEKRGDARWRKGDRCL